MLTTSIMAKLNIISGFPVITYSRFCFFSLVCICLLLFNIRCEIVHIILCSCKLSSTLKDSIYEYYFIHPVVYAHLDLQFEAIIVLLKETCACILLNM